METPTHPARQPFYKVLYIQVIFAVLVGILLGWLDPSLAKNPWIKILGDVFVRMIKLIIAPTIFLTVVSGIAQIESARKVGRLGIIAVVYFEVVSTFALILGLVVGELVQPGAGVTGKMDASAVTSYVDQASKMNGADFFLNLFPESIFDAFAKNNILQILVFSIMFGFALVAMGDKAKPIKGGLDLISQAVFKLIGIVMRFAPIGAFGAMAYTVGAYGASIIGNLLLLIGSFYLTSALFVFIVLGLIAKITGFSLIRFLAYIKEELLLVLGTSSSESALPLLMVKLENLGCAKSVVGLVVPTGYSFNLDGTNIYMTLASLFIAQALNIHLSFADEMTILTVAMVTSKGAAGVTGAGFATLAGTLNSVNNALLPGMSLLLGIDKFMSECRAITNIIGNGVACLAIAAFEGALDRERLRTQLERDDVKWNHLTSESPSQSKT